MNFLKNIPTSAAALLVVMGVLTPVLFLLFQGKDVAPLVTGLYIALAAIAGLGVLLFERSKKSKATGFAKEVESNAASAEGVKDPQRIAQIDHMRKEFQRGIDIYKKHGKDLYSLPWYVVVGESESGKTEMLRRSEIGFPDKLQDRWQGSGGTLSMHWWFSNKAVILDTAGRLFVTEGAEGGQNQWVTFLQMLKKNRPDCPINGLILVIPSNRLLTHPNPDIEATRMAELDRNAGQIAKQMETLQAELGVRFPVYIFITKMDKLNGFREFFGKLDKPEDRYQILGWSNPAPLGSAFDPQSVAEYMRSVADRLNRRMMSELRGVEPENPAGLRIDEVDALYAFPTAFESMTGKLTRYLRHIFTTDEWSAKPPFLRGIYCTSALQQGRVLDEALAAAMGVPLERMDSTQEDDGLSLSRNRTYFVRDLFLDKIFSEKGLVTTAGKIRSSISGWKLWIPAAIILMLVAFGALGLLADKSCPEKERWTAIYESTEKGALIRPLVTWDEQDSKLKPDVGDPEKNAAKTLATLSALGGEVGAPPKFRWIFAPARWFDKDFSKGRPELYTKLVAESLAGVENSLIAKYQAQAGKNDWEKQDWEALHALVLLRAQSAEIKAGELRLSKDGAAFPVNTLLAALFKGAGIAADPTPLRDSLNHAQKLTGNDFAANLKSWRKGELTPLIAKIFPADDLQQQDTSVKDLNAVDDDLTKLTSYDAVKINRLADAVEKLRHSEQALDRRPTYTDAMASDSDHLLAFILANRNLKQQFGFGNLSDASLSIGAKALEADNRTLLKEVADVLGIIKTDPKITLNSTNIDPFVAAPPTTATTPSDDPDAEAITKKAKDIRTNLAALRKAWFKEEFLRKQFLKYLKFPIVRDANTGEEDELLLLWKLCDTADKWKIEANRIEPLVRVFNCFFKFDETKKTLALKKCQIDVQRPPNKAAPRYLVNSKLFNFIAEANPPPQDINLNETIIFKEVSEDGKLLATVPPWGLVKQLDPNGTSWRFTPTGHDVVFDITLEGYQPEALRKWPKTADFEQP